jgi:hypothetical protein
MVDERRIKGWRILFGYKPEGPGIDSRRPHLKFILTQSFREDYVTWVETSINVQNCNGIALLLYSLETDWLRTTWFTSAGMDHYPTDFRYEEHLSRGQTCYRLSRRGTLNILRFRDKWKIVYSHSGVWGFFPSICHTTSPDTLCLKCWTRLVVWKRQKKLQWHCVISQYNSIFMHLFTKHEIRC